MTGKDGNRRILIPGIPDLDVQNDFLLCQVDGVAASQLEGELDIPNRMVLGRVHYLRLFKDMVRFRFLLTATGFDSEQEDQCWVANPFQLIKVAHGCGRRFCV
jgi:hypothetical protein